MKTVLPPALKCGSDPPPGRFLSSAPPSNFSALIPTGAGIRLKARVVCALCLALLLNRRSDHRTIRLSPRTTVTEAALITHTHLLCVFAARCSCASDKTISPFDAPVCRDLYQSDVRDLGGVFPRARHGWNPQRSTCQNGATGKASCTVLR